MKKYSTPIIEWLIYEVSNDILTVSPTADLGPANGSDTSVDVFSQQQGVFN